jgi:hypothetical protein
MKEKKDMRNKGSRGHSTVGDLVCCDFLFSFSHKGYLMIYSVSRSPIHPSEPNGARLPATVAAWELIESNPFESIS